jgi:hypothetical protein
MEIKAKKLTREDIPFKDNKVAEKYVGMTKADAMLYVIRRDSGMSSFTDEELRKHGKLTEEEIRWGRGL